MPEDQGETRLPHHLKEIYVLLLQILRLPHLDGHLQSEINRGLRLLQDLAENKAGISPKTLASLKTLSDYATLVSEVRSGSPDLERMRTAAMDLGDREMMASVIELETRSKALEELRRIVVLRDVARRRMPDNGRRSPAAAGWLRLTADRLREASDRKAQGEL